VYLCIIPATLILHIITDSFFISVLSDSIGIIPACPEVSTPEEFFYFRTFDEYLFCTDRLYSSHYLSNGKHGDALNKEMDVIFICSDLDKEYFVAFTYVNTCFSKNFCYMRSEYFSPILGRENKMIQK